MRTLDPIQAIRGRPEMYLPNRQVDGSWLAQRLASDATILGATRCLFARIDDWWMVAADKDWLATGRESPAELFSKVVAFPEAGVNSMRGEVLIGAFADGLSLATPTECKDLRGIATTPHEMLQTLDRTKWARVVLFHPNPELATGKDSAAEVAVATS